METCSIRNNAPIGPTGYSIVRLSMVDERAMHVAIAYNGGLIWDNGDSREEEYGEITGYFVVYDLEPSEAKWIKKVVNKDGIKRKKKK